MRYDTQFPPEGHPASAASPSRPGGMITYHNITTSPVFRRERGGSTDDDGMPPPAAVPPRVTAGPSAARPPPPPPPPPPVPRIASYPQPLAVSGDGRGGREGEGWFGVSAVGCGC